MYSFPRMVVANDNEEVGDDYYRRYTKEQKAILEEEFKKCPNPDELQRLKLSQELGLDSNKVKYWFQNKRVKAKDDRHKCESFYLRQENESLRAENFAIREKLRSYFCMECKTPLLGEQEQDHQLCSQTLELQNQQLKQELEREYKILEAYGYVRYNQMSRSVMMLTHHTMLPTVDENQDHVPHALNNHSDISALTHQFGSAFGLSSHDDQKNNNIGDDEMVMVVDTAKASIHELTSLLSMDDNRFWFLADGKLNIRRDVYEAMFPKITNHLSNPQAYKEASKDWKMMNVPSAWLVDKFLDADKWVNLFPTIVKRAQTIQVIQGGLDGSMQLMYAEMHILSPLVPTRKVLFLRSCKQMGEGKWIIADVSFHSQNLNGIPYQTWKLPSGCMIQDLTNDSCMVTWVKHVEVDDKMQAHMLFRNLIGNNNAYGAERWLLTLQRMCQRFSLTSLEIIPYFDMGVINMPQGRRSVMYLAQRMVKIFCGSLDMSENVDVTHLANINYSGSRASVRNNVIPGVPRGTIAMVATSIWLPLSPETVFNFLKDSSTRHQWDYLCGENPIYEVQRIKSGTDSDNCISIFQSSTMHNNQSLMILQESCVDSLGAFLVFAPLDMESIKLAISGEDPSVFPLLPSGFTISRDGRNDPLEGSLLTLAIQVLISPPSSTTAGHFNGETVLKVNEMINSVIKKIRAALNCRV